MHPFLPKKLENTTSELSNFVNELNIKTIFEGEIDATFKRTCEIRDNAFFQFSQAGHSRIA